jgi:DNA invertase Pin-like site-specific DNA recombinase
VLATRIDRLARSMFELFAIVKKVIDAGTISQPVRRH